MYASNEGICADSPEPSLLGNANRTKIAGVGTIMLKLVLNSKNLGFHLNWIFFFILFKYFFACRLLITFANSLGPD